VSNTKKDIIVLSFAAKDLPKFEELKQTNKDWVSYGKKNDFPAYLLRLFDGSPKHGAITKGKADYVFGKGFEYKEKQNDKANGLLKIVNRHGESLNKVAGKVILDNEIYEGFYLSVTWAKGGTISDISHIDFTKMRSNPDGTRFYHKEDWSTVKGEIKQYPVFNPEEPIGTQILFYKGYTPGGVTYPRPEYLKGQNHIEADILISEHVLNNASSGFTGSKMINFNDGEPEDGQKRNIEERLNEKFTGSLGSKLMVSFNSRPEVAPTVLDLGSSDLTKEDFTRVDELISQNIFTCHKVVSPMLFGVRVQGQLGGRSEMREAFEIFKNTYCNARQQSIEEVFNLLLSINNLPEVHLVPVEPIGYSLDEIKDYAPKAYIFEKIGINPNDYPADEPEPKKEPAPVEPVEEEFTSAEDELALELFSQVGDSVKKYFRVKSKKVAFSSDEDCIKSELEAYREAYAEITQLEANVIDLLRKDKRATPEVIAKALQVDIDLVKRALGDLSKKGLVKISVEKVGDDSSTTRTVTEEGKIAVEEKRPMTTEVNIRYSYDGPQDERNRPFCARLMELDKLYSRAEIEQVSQRVGYSVWERRGGFYHNPKTGETTPYCRHHWTQHVVIKRK
jgi:DNA-binding MarR family transcriptional regulator